MRVLARLLPAGVAAIVTLAMAASARSIASDGQTGLRGVVTRGPTAPVCRSEIPCVSPVPRVVITFVRRGAAHRVRTDADGRYRIVLGSGRYEVSVLGARFGYTPRAVAVTAGRFRVTNIRIDTGIR